MYFCLRIIGNLDKAFLCICLLSGYTYTQRSFSPSTLTTLLLPSRMIDNEDSAWGSPPPSTYWNTVYGCRQREWTLLTKVLAKLTSSTSWAHQDGPGISLDGGCRVSYSSFTWLRCWRWESNHVSRDYIP